MFCRDCNYDLRALDARACPECGARFDPANTTTWLAVPRPSAWRRGAIIAGLIVSILLIPFGATGYVVLFGGEFPLGGILCACGGGIGLSLLMVIPAIDLCRSGRWRQAAILAIVLGVLDVAWIPMGWIVNWLR